MKKIGIILTLCLLVTLPISAQAREITNQSPNTLTVQGAAHLDVLPDQAVVTVGVVSTGQTAAEARQDNATTALAIQQKLLSLGISKDKIHTSQYTFNPIYSNDSEKSGTKAPTIIGYRVNNTIMVTSEDIEAIGTIIDISLAAGANQISSIRFQKKDELQLKQTLLQDAVKDGIAKAEAIAAALGKHIGQPLTVTEGGVSVQASELQRALFKADSATPIAAGTVQVSGSVGIVFELL
jgi:uncharacterized protein